MMCLSSLRQGQAYNFHIKPVQCGEEALPGIVQTRVFLGHIRIERIPFSEVFNKDRDKPHLIAVETLEDFEPA